MCVQLNNIQYEQNLFEKGIKLVAGVDEVGRGPLAGPFVVCAAILDIERIIAITAEDGVFRNNDVTAEVKKAENSEQYAYSQIKDSKLLSHKKRVELNTFLLKNALSFSIVEISSSELDKIGISTATQRAFYQAITTLKVKPQHILTDMFAVKNIPQDKQSNIPQGDKKSITIGAASIIAKVYRDNLMQKYHEMFPQYGFDAHKGYGTKKHLECLKNLGPCAIHRRSFEPVRAITNSN